MHYICSVCFGQGKSSLMRVLKRRRRPPADGGGRGGDAGSCRSHLELSVLLLEVLVFVRVAVWELVDLDAVLLDLLADLEDREGGEKADMWASVVFFLNGCANERILELSLP